MAEGAFPPWFESRLPSREECSLGLRLEQLAGEEAEATFLVRKDGGSTSRADLLGEIRATAGRLARLGVVHGERVLVWLPTGPEMVRYIFALSMLGATIVPLNTSLRGAVLEQMIALADARIMIAHPDLIERLGRLSLPRPRNLVVPGDRTPVSVPGGMSIASERSIDPADFEIAGHQPWDIAAIIFSSGTTGPSKGVRVPAAQLWTLSRVFYGYMRPDDRMLLMYPLFHIAGLSAIYGAVNAGASIAVTEAFSATKFWDELRRTGSTTTPGLGPTFISILEKPAPLPGDAQNPLRHVNVQAITPAARAFAARFGCDIMGSYSMTETSGICVSPVNATKEGMIGRPRDGLEVRIVDANDVDVPVGEPGELILRSDLPWTLNAGYHGNGEATAAAWRNGWFHTGDVVRRDADGDISFVDRKKDVIRRRSENISSSEVEAEVRLFPAVQDAAAIGVIAAEGEEVLVAVTAVPGREIEPRALAEFLIERLPHYMVPRFVRILPELPKTHTNRVQKERLREEGVTADCWDREAAGLRLRGQRLGSLS